MRNKDNENLKILNQFFDKEETRIFLDDLKWADELFRQNEYIGLNDDRLVTLKARINRELGAKKKHRVMKLTERVVAAAALIAILFAISTVLFKTERNEPSATKELARDFWDSTTLDDADLVLSTLNAEAKQLESEFFDVSNGNGYKRNNSSYDDLEMEFIDIQTASFWKG